MSRHEYTITRKIGLDCGHRVWTHGSKCKNFHGHRYEIMAECGALKLSGEGEQSGMVLDFGFLKELMMEEIDAPCDHGMIIDIHDPEYEGWMRNFSGYKTYVVDFIPTAENLAEHWFTRLENGVKVASNGRAELLSVIVQETPNSVAVYRPAKEGEPHG